MEVTKYDFQEKLPDILESIEKSVFVSFDLEYSGIMRDNAPGVEKVQGRKQTIDERYQNIKYGASKYQVFQMGICTIEYDPKQMVYITRPFNFYVCPIVKKGVGVIREFAVESDGLDFLVEHDFDFNKLFKTGVPFLSHAEDRSVREKWAEVESKFHDDIKVEESQTDFVKTVRKEVTTWLTNPKKRLVHQLIRAEFPALSTSGKRDFVQISFKDEEKEEENKDFKRNRFNRETSQAAGLRLIVDKLIEKRKVLVGHNCFSDLAYLYRTFIDALPDTVEQFAAVLRKDFQMILDTKFMATFADGPHNMDRKSSLQEIYEDLHRQRMPEIDLHFLHRSYILTNTNHVAGFDAWTTAKVLIKLAVRLQVLGFDKTISFAETESATKPADDTTKINTMGTVVINGTQTGKNTSKGKAETRVSRPEENWSKIVDLENTPEKAVLPQWNDEFWTFFANKLRVFGTVEGVLEF